ncbi:MAG: 2-C-methyl-D-erythritol 4-phosphate cytidylyltransferase [Solirubrobacterales bacterium]|nr:2-C-methyl-D-erythritol 4-phosphate cytidylyltransferase [Solirubrobacterales bacterium]
MTPHTVAGSPPTGSRVALGYPLRPPAAPSSVCDAPAHAPNPHRASSAASVTAVIAAAGSGERLGADGPKAFVPLAGRPMVEWSIAAFRAAEPVGSIVVACPPGHVHELGGRDLGVVEGGETRSASVSSALEAVGTELVAVHDAARPLLTSELIADVVATLVGDPGADGAIAATPVTDTIKQAAPPATTSAPLPGVETVSGALVVESTLDRGPLWAAQTPQVFRVEALRRALGADPDRVAAATDEAMLVEAAGGRVLIHPSPPENLKVTTPLDLRLAELLLSARSAQ